MVRILAFTALCVVFSIGSMAVANFLVERNWVSSFLTLGYAIIFGIISTALILIAAPLLLPTVDAFFAGIVIWAVANALPMRGLANPYG